MGEIVRIIFIRRFSVQNALQYRHSDFQKFICDNRATFRVTLVNIVPVIPEFKNKKCVQLLVSFFKINLSDKLSQDSLNRFLPNFHRMVAI